MVESAPHESHRTTKDVLEELERLRAVSAASWKTLTEIQKKITELQSHLETLPNGSMRAKKKE